MGYPVCMIGDPKFDLLRSVLSTRRTELKEMGLGNLPHAADELTDEDVELYWRSGAFGKKDPRTLQHTVYFLLGNAFGWRARDETFKCRWGDVSVHHDEDGCYLEWNERTSKTRKGSGPPRKYHPKIWEIEDKERCGVTLYHLMATKRPPHLDDTMYFFLTPKHKCSMDEAVGYKDNRMGYGCIGEMMTRVKDEASLQGQITGHTMRRTMMTNLLQQGISPTLIQQNSGHKDVNSVLTYATASRDQQKLMADISAGGKRPASKKKASAAAGSAQDAVCAPPSPPPSPPPCAPPATYIPAAAAPPATYGPPSAQVSAAQVPSAARSDIAGMFAGAHIQGNVSIHLHYGHVATSHSSQNTLNMSPVLPIHHDSQ